MENEIVDFNITGKLDVNAIYAQYPVNHLVERFLWKNQHNDTCDMDSIEIIMRVKIKCVCEEQGYNEPKCAVCSGKPTQMYDWWESNGIRTCSDCDEWLLTLNRDEQNESEQS